MQAEMFGSEWLYATSKAGTYAARRVGVTVGPFRGDADGQGQRANAQIHADMPRDGGAQ